MSREQRAQVDAMMRQPRPEARTVEAMRARFAATMARMTVPSGIRTTETTLGGRRALLVEPTERQRPGTILYLHGGAWVLGSPETSLGLTANLVVRTGMRSLSLDYRLAPENPFPAAIQDTLAAYRALVANCENPAGLAVAGDSAGGGLSVTSLLAARDEGLPMPAAIVAFSAGLDATCSGESMDSKDGIDPLFTRETLRPTVEMYRAGQDLRQPLLSPAICADLSGLPPMLLQAGANEVLSDDSTRMTTRAIEAGVDVILDVTAGVPHVFQSFAGFLDEADQALDRAAFFLAQRVLA
jgi:acetyl esterase/lipase